MRKGVLIMILPILALVQGATALPNSSPHPNSYYFELYGQSTTGSQDFLRFVQKLESHKDAKGDSKFLRYVFTKTHQRYLKHYETYAGFNELTINGNYNCLTGTALYALILDQLGYEFRIIETNYHIFLVVNSKEGQILFEATDPAKGFISDAAAVAKRMSAYKENQTTQLESGKNYYLYSFKLFNEVNLDQMAGLLYYNEAIEEFNDHHFQDAVADLDKAMSLYNSPRIAEFSKIILLSVVQSQLESSVKENCVKKIQSIRKQRMPAIGAATKSE
jgi:hypothetical protein